MPCRAPVTVPGPRSISVFSPVELFFAHEDTQKHVRELGKMPVKKKTKTVPVKLRKLNMMNMAKKVPVKMIENVV